MVAVTTTVVVVVIFSVGNWQKRSVNTVMKREATFLRVSVRCAVRFRDGFRDFMEIKEVECNRIE